MTRPTLDRVREWLTKLTSERPVCSRCEYRTDLEAYMSGWEGTGWEPFDICTCVYVRRCSRCANSKAYPWAASLDPACVADWLAANVEPGYEIDLDRMHRECADRGGFSFL